MRDQWHDIKAAVESSESDQVNEAIDQIKELDREHRLQLFDIRIDSLTDIYEESDDGYVRQSVVRVTERMMPGLAVVVMLDGADSTDETREDIRRRLDTATGFLLDALQDSDGRVRQSAKRALKDAYRGYEALEETETIAALVDELDALAESYEGKRRKHLLESKDDAAFFLRPAGSRMVDNIRELAGHERER